MLESNGLRGVAAASTLLSMLGASTALGQRGYVIEEFRTLAGTTSSSGAITVDGRVVGSSANIDGRDAVMWAPLPMVLPRLPGGDSASARGVSPDGRFVAGEADADDHREQPVIWRDGAVIDLGGFGGDRHDAQAVNDNGQVVGSSEDLDGDSRPFLWEAGRMTDLGTLGGPVGVARAINADGVIVGSSYDAERDQRPTMWRDGEILDITGQRGRATDVNDRDQVVGWVSGSGGFLWENGNIRVLEGVSEPHAVNNARQVVGYGGETGAVLWQDGIVTELNRYVSPCSPVPFLGGAGDINDEGVIVASGSIVVSGVDFWRVVRLTGFSCADVIAVKARCRKNGGVRASVETTLPEGMKLHLVRDLVDCRPIEIDPEGRAKAKWPDSTPANLIMLAECPDTLTLMECQ